MIRISGRHSHFVFGVIQSGLTCGVAAAVAELRSMTGRALVMHWLESWLFSWVVMLPVVLLAAPYIRRIVRSVTDEPTT